MGAYSKGEGLLTICSSRVGAYSRGGLFQGGRGRFEDLRYVILRFWVRDMQKLFDDFSVL